MNIRWKTDFVLSQSYGLPYSPGSGVKGILRRAAELLAVGEFGDQQHWTPVTVDALFGKETEPADTETARNRGALTFWDVLPELAGSRLMVEIMTPHYSDYYQGNTTPHDSGQPNPIVFLALPPNSRFEFFVQCNQAALPESLRNNWQTLLETAFQHAFDWLGFGAKQQWVMGSLIIMLLMMRVSNVKKLQKSVRKLKRQHMPKQNVRRN